jgi:hypothetical protein
MMVQNNDFEVEGLRRLVAPIHAEKPSRMKRILNRLRKRKIKDSANPKKDKKRSAA